MKEVIEACKQISTGLKALAAILETGATVEGKRAKNSGAKGFDDDEQMDAAKEETEQQESFDFDSEDSNGDEGQSEEIEAEDDDFTSSPAAAKKSAKAKKITIAQVNDACKARAKAGGKEGRAQVLSILKKHFKTQSVSEIKPELYAKVIQAMKVSN